MPDGIDFAESHSSVFVLLQASRLDKGKSFERMRRKATGLTPWFKDMVAGLPSDGGIFR
jgi:hypothetical protein